jgi:hypothetical protein
MDGRRPTIGISWGLLGVGILPQLLAESIKAPAQVNRPDAWISGWG